MRIGGQRNLITIQRQVQLGVTDLNEPNMVWADWRPDIFCEVSVRRGKEQFDPSTKQRFSEEVWHFRTRYDEVIGADSTMQVLHEGQIFDIRNVMPDGQRHSDAILECIVRDGTLSGKALSIAITEMIRKGVVGKQYRGFKIAVKGGAEPLAVTISAGALPPGLLLDPVSLTIVGTPTVAGTYPVQFRVTDVMGAVETLPSFDMEIGAA